MLHFAVLGGDLGSIAMLSMFAPSCALYLFRCPSFNFPNESVFLLVTSSSLSLFV